MSQERKELELRYRPQYFDEYFGGDALKASLKESLLTKHVYLFHGPRGCGKTTLARLLGLELEISKDDTFEINGAAQTGIEEAKEIQASVSLMPMSSKHKLYIIDEVHGLSGKAKDSWLKTLEEPPEHCYFALCTTELDKVPATIKSRPAKFEVKPLDPEKSLALLNWICKEEKLQVSEIVKQAIIKQCEGIPREMVVLLDMVKAIKEDESLELIEASTGNKQVIDLCWALLNKDPWSKISSLLKEIPDDAESARYAILGVMNSILLKNTNQQKRASYVMSFFLESFMYTRKPGLSLACYMAVSDD